MAQKGPERWTNHHIILFYVPGETLSHQEDTVWSQKRTVKGSSVVLTECISLSSISKFENFFFFFWCSSAHEAEFISRYLDSFSLQSITVWKQKQPGIYGVHQARTILNNSQVHCTPTFCQAPTGLSRHTGYPLASLAKPLSLHWCTADPLALEADVLSLPFSVSGRCTKAHKPTGVIRRSRSTIIWLRVGLIYTAPFLPKTNLFEHVPNIPILFVFGWFQRLTDRTANITYTKKKCLIFFFNNGIFLLCVI